MTPTLHIPGFLSFVVAGLLIVAAPITAQAAERQHDAHEHGVSTAKLAIDGDSVEIELRSPGADIVGFEHKPATDADKATVKKAAGMLAKGADVFAPAQAAGCQLTNAVVEAPGIEVKHKGHDHGDDHGKGDGKDEHGHGHHDEKHAELEKHAEDGHSEFSATYHFKCRNIDKLTHIDVRLFDRFPAARELEVQAITPAGQILRELKPGSARLVF